MKILLYCVHDHANAGIRSLGAWLKHHGHEVRLVFLGSVHGLRTDTSIPENYFAEAQLTDDFTLIIHTGHINIPEPDLDFPIPESFLALVHDWQPDLIGYSGRSILNNYFKDWFPGLKKIAPMAHLTCGGYGPSLDPHIYLDRGADSVIRGEGENALLSLVSALEKGEAWQGINNVVYRGAGGRLVYNAMGTPIRNLDSLPFPMFHDGGIYLVRGNELLEEDPLPRGNVDVVMTRGCIGNCGYCSAVHWRSMYENFHCKMPKYRYPSNDKLLEMLKFHKSHGAKQFYIKDDFFIRPYTVLKDFLARYKREIDLPFDCYPNLDLLQHHPDILEDFYQAGMSALNLPIQSADDDLNRNVFNRHSDFDAIVKLAADAAERFIPFHTHFIDGMIFEGHDPDRLLAANMDFLKRLPPFHPGFPALTNFHSSYLRVHKDSPLSRKGFIQKMDVAEFFRRAMFLLFRYLMSDTEYDAFVHTWQSKSPEPLLNLFLQYRHNLHTRYMLEKAQEYAGRDILIWGGGDVYRNRRQYLLGMKPVAIVSDIPVPQKIIDGIAVRDLKKSIEETGYLPIFICIRNAMACARKLKAMFPDYPNELIIGYGIY